jgi:RNase H-like domain found in reverse transcriptase
MEHTPIEITEKGRIGSGKKSVWMQWKEKDWEWTEEQQESFDYIKRCVSEFAMSRADPELQYHLATDASKYGLGGVLFQLHGELAGTEAFPKHKKSERIVMFMSFRLSDAETRYTNTEREALAVVRCLAEVR